MCNYKSLQKSSLESLAGNDKCVESVHVFWAMSLTFIHSLIYELMTHPFLLHSLTHL